MSANPAPGRQRQGNHRGQPGVCGETLSQNNKKTEKEKKNWRSLSLEKEIKKLEQLSSYSQSLINNCHKGFSFLKKNTWVLDLLTCVLFIPLGDALHCLRDFPSRWFPLEHASHIWKSKMTSWQILPTSTTNNKNTRRKVTMQSTPALFWKTGSWSRLPSVSHSPCKHLFFLSVKRPL